MKNATIRGYLIDPTRNFAGEVIIENSLDALYKSLHCDIVQVASRRIGIRNKHYYDIICDEQGTFVDDPFISAIDNLGNPMLVGAIFICNHDDEGYWTDLTDKQIVNIKNHVMMQATRRHPNPYWMLMQCEY